MTSINPCHLCGRQPEIAEGGDHAYYAKCYHDDDASVFDATCYFDRPTLEKAIADWNRDNPLTERTWFVASEKQMQLRKWYDVIRLVMEVNRNLYAEDACVNARIKQIDTMSYDELMDMIEADTVLFDEPAFDYKVPSVQGDCYDENLVKQCIDQRVVRLQTIIKQMVPENYVSMPDFVRKRVAQLRSMTVTQLHDEIAAEYVLFG